jgi:hypothetical protein
MMTEPAFLIPDADVETIWGADLRPFGCLDCGTAHLLPPGWQGSGCPACLSDRFERQPVRARREPPELILPFASDLTPDYLSEQFQNWLRGVWLRPQDLRVERLLARLNRVFVPRWLVDGQVVGVWHARMGFDYLVESSLERFDEGSGWQSKMLKETRVRWEPRMGRINRTYHNESVPALEEDEGWILQARVGSFPKDSGVAYRPASIAGAAVRVPSLLPKEAWPLARMAFDRSVERDCQRAAGAQHCEEFALVADYRNRNWTQMLLPLYVTYYEDDVGQRIPVWVNGQTGQVAGLRRASLRMAWHLAGGVGAIALLGFLLGVVLGVLDQTSVASVLMTLSFLLVIVAIFPVVWAWQFNRPPDRSVEARAAHRR